MLRGTIIDAIPEAQARIQLVTGEIATVPWPQILRIERAGAPPANSPPSTKPPAPPSEVWDHLEGSEGVVLPGVTLPASWTRAPTWATAAPEQKGLPPGAGIPIFSGHF